MLSRSFLLLKNNFRLPFFFSAVGSSTHLKNRFAGYKLNLAVQTANSQAAQDFVTKGLAGSSLQRETVVDGVAYLIFTLTPATTKHLVPFLKKLEAERELVQDFSVSQTTLEEVFLNVSVISLAAVSPPLSH